MDMISTHGEDELRDLYGEIYEFIIDDNVTNIEWNGWDLWITDLVKGCYLSEIKLSDEFVMAYSVKLSNSLNKDFNKTECILESSFDNLRVSIWHESIVQRRSITIRKNPPFLRWKSHEDLIIQEYCPDKLLSLLENCVKAHMNVVIGGIPEAGKTEFLKYLSTYIPRNEKAATYEDQPEIHYRVINPGKNCVEVVLQDGLEYETVIKAGLRHNVKWALLSEARIGNEVLALMNSLSTGVHALTTLHVTDNIMDIPDRLFNMIGAADISSRFVNNIYRYLQVGVLVTKNEETQKRQISQVCFFTRENHENKAILIYDHGEFTEKKIPESLLSKFKKYKVNDPWANTR